VFVVESTLTLDDLASPGADPDIIVDEGVTAYKTTIGEFGYASRGRGWANGRWHFGNVNKGELRDEEELLVGLKSSAMCVEPP
jgi:hypothetical protein